ncbi:MAG: DUF4235 domain-containing protein [Actinobacteria bacterium]|nr:DUF4235 domain-containing protein [Actinomycetota bacterium]
MKLLFIPFSVVGGLIAGFLGKKLFEGAWGLIDDEEPPQPEHRYVSFAKVLLASALEGAIFRAVRAAVDHQSRQTFANLTGSWPGEEAPEPE